MRSARLECQDDSKANKHLGVLNLLHDHCCLPTRTCLFPSPMRPYDDVHIGCHPDARQKCTFMLDSGCCESISTIAVQGSSISNVPFICHHQQSEMTTIVFTYTHILCAEKVTTFIIRSMHTTVKLTKLLVYSVKFYQ